jgi:hypothetical protein
MRIRRLGHEAPWPRRGAPGISGGGLACLARATRGRFRADAHRGAGPGAGGAGARAAHAGQRQGLADADFGENRPSLAGMLHLVWIRESVNSMLPVARIGGEIVSFRLMRRGGWSASMATASLVVDMQLTLISQMMFAWSASASCSRTPRPPRCAWQATRLGRGGADAGACAVCARPARRARSSGSRACSTAMTSGHFTALVGESAQIDETIK